MDGKGIMERTHELENALWSRAFWGYAAFGTIAMISITVEPAFWRQHLGFSLPPIGFAVGLLCLVPWCISAVRLSRHTRRLNKETKRNGRGWAES